MNNFGSLEERVAFYNANPNAQANKGVFIALRNYMESVRYKCSMLVLSDIAYHGGADDVKVVDEFISFLKQCNVESFLFTYSSTSALSLLCVLVNLGCRVGLDMSISTLSPYGERGMVRGLVIHISKSNVRRAHDGNFVSQ